MNCLVLGAGGFIGHALVKRLKGRGDYVVGIDLEPPAFEKTTADIFHEGNLRQLDLWPLSLPEPYDEIYALAADMGGMGFIGVGIHDADLMSNSARINLNVADYAARYQYQGCKVKTKLFFSSSACVYNQSLQVDPANHGLREQDAYPAAPDSEYGWEKLFSERLYLAYARNHGLNVRIARFHNVFGPMGTYEGGREKAPAAICRKVAMAPPNGTIEIWGDGQQTRSFLYIDDCLDGIQALMTSDCKEPVNIGSEEMVSINELARLAMMAANKQLTIKHIDGPLGVRGRNSDNTFCKKAIGWEPKMPLYEGIQRTYEWIAEQIIKGK